MALTQNVYLYNVVLYTEPSGLHFCQHHCWHGFFNFLFLSVKWV